MQHSTRALFLQAFAIYRSLVLLQRGPDCFHDGLSYKPLVQEQELYSGVGGTTAVYCWGQYTAAWTPKYTKSFCAESAPFVQ